MTDQELFEFGWLDPSRPRPSQILNTAARHVEEAALATCYASGVRVVCVVLPPFPLAHGSAVHLVGATEREEARKTLAQTISRLSGILEHL
jgi:hypothetical protein